MFFSQMETFTLPVRVNVSANGCSSLCGLVLNRPLAAFGLWQLGEATADPYEPELRTKRVF